MSFTYDPSTDAGRVRMLIPDRVGDGHAFEDEEIETFLELEGGNVRRAAALALETCASDQALTLKVVRLVDITTDGRAVSEALLQRAGKLRAQADDAEAAEDGGLFDIAEWTPTDFAGRERLYKQAQRGGA